MSSAQGKDKSQLLVQNHGSVRLMGLGSHWFLSLTRKLPQIVVQAGPPHDVSRSVQNELEFACFCEVLGRRTKRSVLVPVPRVSAGISRGNALLRGRLQ